MSESDVVELCDDPVAIRHAVARAFGLHGDGKVVSKPKLSLELPPSRKFQSLCAVSPDLGIAVNKWVGVAPAPRGSSGRGVQATILVNDVESGRPLAAIEANHLTGVRTAAMSAIAAEHLAPDRPHRIGLVGCGLQARAHLVALHALFGMPSEVRATSRTNESRQEFARWAMESLGIQVKPCTSARELLRWSSLAVTTVPAGGDAFLDPDWIAPGAFVSAVDLGRAFLAERLGTVEYLLADDHEQERSAPLFPQVRPFDADLGELVGARARLPEASERRLFVFRGHAVADLGMATFVYRSALKREVGTKLPA